MFTASSTELLGVQERVSDGFEVEQHTALKCLHHHRGQGDGSVIIESSDLCFFGDRDDGGGLEAGGMGPILSQTSYLILTCPNYNWQSSYHACICA